jgi:hypothetical protein
MKSLAFISVECIGTDHAECLVEKSPDFRGECGECRLGSVEYR